MQWIFILVTLVPVALAQTTGTTGTTGAPAPVCGNGILELDEQCDDNNTANFDGCSSTCLKEHACCFTCDVAGTNRSGCYSDTSYATQMACENYATNTLCPDNYNGTFVSAKLTVNGSCATDCDGPVCGDGNLDAGEECDDGNIVPGDGCARVCELEYACCRQCLNSTTNETVSTSCADRGATWCDLKGSTCPTNTTYVYNLVEGAFCVSNTECPVPVVTTTTTGGTPAEKTTSGSTDLALSIGLGIGIPSGIAVAIGVGFVLFKNL